jgi:hypothetical protein
MQRLFRTAIRQPRIFRTLPPLLLSQLSLLHERTREEGVRGLGVVRGMSTQGITARSCVLLLFSSPSFLTDSPFLQVDELTRQNQELKARLRRLEGARCPTELKKERLFEIRWHDGLSKCVAFFPLFSCINTYTRLADHDVKKSKPSSLATSNPSPVPLPTPPPPVPPLAPFPPPTASIRLPLLPSTTPKLPPP